MWTDLGYLSWLALIIGVCAGGILDKVFSARKNTGHKRGATPISVMPNGTQFDVCAVCDDPRFVVLATRTANGNQAERVLYDLGNDIRVPSGAKIVELRTKVVLEPVSSVGQPVSYTQGAAQ